jgi:hypothetical protein
VTGFSEHINTTSVSVKGIEILDQLRDYQLPKDSYSLELFNTEIEQHIKLIILIPMTQHFILVRKLQQSSPSDLTVNNAISYLAKREIMLVRFEFPSLMTMKIAISSSMSYTYLQTFHFNLFFHPVRCRQKVPHKRRHVCARLRRHVVKDNNLHAYSQYR